MVGGGQNKTLIEREEERHTDRETDTPADIRTYKLTQFRRRFSNFKIFTLHMTLDM